MPKLAQHIGMTALLAMWLAVFGLLATGCNNGAASETAGAAANVAVQKAAVPVRTISATTETKEVQRRYSGYAHPFDTHGVGFLVGGRVTAITVKEGDIVKKGELLATLDSSDYALMKQLAQTQVEAIKPNYERVKKLVAKDVVPQSQLDVLQGQYDAAVTQREQAERQIRYTRVYAPVDGVVHELRTAVGQVIGQGSPAVILLQVDKLKVKFGVSQQELAAFEPDKAFSVEVPGVTDGIEGLVTHIDYVADPTTRTYNVTITIPNPGHKLRPGMLARIHVVKASLSGIFVPISAVVKDSEGHAIVKLVDGQTQKVVAQPVTLGSRYDEQLQITGGLTGGEQVITSGNTIAAVGDTVEIQ